MKIQITDIYIIASSAYLTLQLGQYTWRLLDWFDNYLDNRSRQKAEDQENRRRENIANEIYYYLGSKGWSKTKARKEAWRHVDSLPF